MPGICCVVGFGCCSTLKRIGGGRVVQITFVVDCVARVKVVVVVVVKSDNVVGFGIACESASFDSGLYNGTNLKKI